MSNRLPLFVAIFMALAVATAPVAAQDNVPQLISYQGQLIVGGQPVSGSEMITFELYDQQEGGSPLGGWREERNVLVENGVFTVLLGESQSLPEEVFKENGTVYLSVGVNGGEVRMPLTSTPFSFRAAFADEAEWAGIAGEAESVQAGAVSGAALADGAVTEDKLADDAVTRDKIAEDGAVKRLNGLYGSVELVAGSGIALNEDGNQIQIINTGGNDNDGDPPGVISLTAGTGLEVNSPIGDITIGIRDGGVDRDQLASEAVVTDKINNQAVTSAKLASGAVTTPKIEDEAITAAKLAGNAAVLELNERTGVLTIEGTGAASVSTSGNTITIDVDETGGLDAVATDGSLAGSGTSGSPLRIASGATVRSLQGLTDDITFEGENIEISTDGQTIRLVGEAPDGGLTSVSTDNTLDGDGTSGSPLGLASDAAVLSLNERAGALTLSGGTGINVSENDDTITISSTGEGGLTSVSTDGTLDGDGTSGSPLGIASGTTVRSLQGLTDDITFEGENIEISTDGQTIRLVGEGPDGGLTSVSTDNTLDGDGTSGSPLGLASDAAVLSLNDLTGGVELIPGDNISISPNAGQGTIEISVDNSLSGQAMGVSSLNGLTDDVAIVDGDGIEMTIDGQDIILEWSPGGGRIGTEELADGAVTSEKLSSDAAVTSVAVNGEPVQNDVTLDAGSGIEISANGQTITIEADGTETSSIRFKDKVMPLEDAVALIQQLEGVRYAWREDGRRDVGLIAEDVAEVIPEVVSYEEDESTVRGLNYGKLVSVLVEATKEQQETIERQQDTIDEMEARLARLERLVEQTAAAESGNAE